MSFLLAIILHKSIVFNLNKLKLNLNKCNLNPLSLHPKHMSFVPLGMFTIMKITDYTITTSRNIN